MSILKKISDRAKMLPRDSNLRIANFLHRMGRSHEYHDIDKILSKHHTAGGLKNPVQSHKLWSLQKLLIQHKPESIIEFGSGLSTFIFSEYAKIEGTKILSIDEEEKWADNTRNLIQNPKVTVISKPRICLLDKTPSEIKYDFETSECFDMAFIDGPNLKIDGKRIPAINSNVFDLPELPRVIVVDGRQETAEFIAEMPEYNVEISDLFTKNYVMSDYNHFSVCIRR